jgi:hypothetical protein
MQLEEQRLYSFSISRSRLIKTLLFAEFFFLCTTFNLFDFGGRNLLFISFTALIGLLMIGIHYRRLPTLSASLALLSMYLCFSFLCNIGSAKASSFLYSLFFLFSFWLIYSFFKSETNQNEYADILKKVLIAYFIVLLLGQLYVALGYFSFNFSAGSNIVHNSFGTLYEKGEGAFRYYSLSTEPSYAAFIVIVLFYSYLKNSPGKPFSNKNIPLWFMLLYMIYSFRSGYGIILFSLLIVFYLKKTESLLPMLVFGGVVVLVVVFLKTNAVERVSTLFSKIDFNNIKSIRDIDYSASFRILPFIYYVDGIHLLDPHFYFGYGAGTSSDFLIPLLFDTPVDRFDGGFLPQFLYDYGILFIIVLALFFKEDILKSFFSFEMIVIVIMMTNTNFNTQLFWIVLICFALNKHYARKPVTFA